MSDSGDFMAALPACPLPEFCCLLWPPKGCPIKRPRQLLYLTNEINTNTEGPPTPDGGGLPLEHLGPMHDILVYCSVFALLVFLWGRWSTTQLPNKLHMETYSYLLMPGLILACFFPNLNYPDYFLPLGFFFLLLLYILLSSLGWWVLAPDILLSLSSHCLLLLLF